MSNDRHLTINDGTMGSLFRRVTLASLGLDSMDGVSEQAFDVIDKADSFAARLLGGVSSVMPKIDSERLGTQATILSDHIFEGMSGLNGPSSATDLGEWQYWLDAVLLMLFDEDEEDEVSVRNGKTAAASPKSIHQTNIRMSQEDIKKRVAALRKSGIKPAMLQSLPQSAKRALAHELQHANAGSNESGTSVESGTNANSGTIANSEFVAQTLLNAIQSAAQTGNIRTNTVLDRIFAQNSRQVFASHVAEKASSVAAQLSSLQTENTNPRVVELTSRWNDAVRSLGTQKQADMASVRDMFTTLDELEKLGTISKEQVRQLRHAGSAYARQLFIDEISHDVTAIATRLENTLRQNDAQTKSMLVSQRAMSAVRADKLATVENFRKSFAALNSRIQDLSNAVSSKVMSDGETAATLRWSRAADRFSRLQGVSDDIDLVLLKDMAESAVELNKAGIIPQPLVNAIIKASAQFNAPQDKTASVSDALSHFGSARILGSLASRIERSIDNLVSDLAKTNTGLTTASIDAFVADLRQIVSTGNADHSIGSAAQTASVIESICDRLDTFAEMASASIVANGYDDLTMESNNTFVSVAENAPAADNNIAEIRRIQNSIAAAGQVSRQQLQSLIAAHRESTQNLTKEQSETLQNLASATSVESLIQAQKALEPHLNSEARTQLSGIIHSIQQSQIKLDNVTRQLGIIESAAKLSKGLRSAAVSGDARRMTGNASLSVDGFHIDGNYLNSLAGTLTAYASKARSEFAGYKPAISDAIEARLDNMLSIVKPEQSQIISSVGEDKNDSMISVSSEISLGYDEIIPDSIEWIKAAEHYPSKNTFGDLSGLLGNRKAAALHASDVISGKTASLDMLASAISRMNSHEAYTPVSLYSETPAGEHVKVSLGIRPNQSAASSFALRQNVGNTYQPAALRESVTPSAIADFDITHRTNPQMVSGAGEFVPVITGMKAASSQNQEGRQAVSNILGSSMGTQDGISSIADKFRLNIGGVDFTMSPDSFVQMVAKPTFSTASLNMPSLMNADNILFAGYASLMNESGDHRTIKALRHAYVESLTRAGLQSAHSEVGFSTQNFTSIFGADATLLSSGRQTVSHSNSNPNSNYQAQRLAAAESIAHDTSLNFSQEITDQKESVAAPFADNAEFSWVSTQVRPSISMQMNAQPQSGEHFETERQLLGRIDNMLDYVEKMSDRNVGVFSTDETVRVLLEALPPESTLGNKGLPKWRHKDTKATRATEARELREALAKIGATPVQGVQRLANKQYVSPNLLQQNQSAAPLFSGGNEGTTMPRAAANASMSGDNRIGNASIPDEDLQFIAEEVFHKIEESLNEEHQRRRSE
ncbi:MAG: hypothetical protein IJM59_09855 [Proteobacteria bacterium]|nr:hypothetical protein [Pseudomonadota bacterium]